MHSQHYRVIDISTWKRRNTFLCFKSFDFPNSILGCELDISAALPFWKERSLSPFLSMVFAVCRAANAIPSFRQRIRNNTVIEFERIHASFTVPMGEDSFGIKRVEYNSHFVEFYKNAKAVSARDLDPGSSNSDLKIDSNYSDEWVFLSCTPRIRFTHVVQAVDKSNSSIPRILWGKFTKSGDRILVPFSVQTHHALVDGQHKMKFLENLQTYFDAPGTIFV